MNKQVASLVLIGSMVVAGQAHAGASANVGVTSNYIWRGVTQTEKDPALQAGLDYSLENGIYVGTWASNSNFAGAKGPEVDLYAGYKKDLKGGLAFDTGVTKYFYPEKNSVEFAEFYVKPSYKGLGAELAYTIDSNNNTGAGQKGDIYYGLGYSGSIMEGLNYAAKVGHTNYKDAAADDYNHYQLSLSKTVGSFGDITLAVDDNDLPNTDVMPSISWKKTFEF